MSEWNKYVKEKVRLKEEKSNKENIIVKKNGVKPVNFNKDKKRGKKGD